MTSPSMAQSRAHLSPIRADPGGHTWPPPVGRSLLSCGMWRWAWDRCRSLGTWWATSGPPASHQWNNGGGSGSYEGWPVKAVEIGRYVEENQKCVTWTKTFVFLEYYSTVDQQVSGRIYLFDTNSLQNHVQGINSWWKSQCLPITHWRVNARKK